MSTEQNKEVVRRFITEALSGRNLGLADEVLAPNYVNRMTGADLAAFKGMLTGMSTALTDVRFEIDDLVAEGDSVVARWKMEATHTGSLMGESPTGKRVSATHKDSCVELFSCSPKLDRGYFSFEINCGGAMTVLYVTDPTRLPDGFFKESVWLSQAEAEASHPAALHAQGSRPGNRYTGELDAGVCDPRVRPGTLCRRDRLTGRAAMARQCLQVRR